MDKPEQLMLDDVEQVRLLAQPARYRAVEELFASQRPTTATRLASIAGVTPSSMSYHLRELEGKGMVRRVAGSSGDGRERLWEAPALSYTITVSDYQDEQGRIAVLDAYLNPMRDRMSAVLAERGRHDLAERDDPYTVLANGHLLLTRDELRELQGAVVALWERFEQKSRGRFRAEGLESAAYMWSMVPDDPPVPDPASS